MARAKPTSPTRDQGRAPAWWRNLLKGLAAPTYVYSRRTRAYPHRSVAEALRGDWLVVSHDMQTAANGLYDERQRR